MAPLGCAMGSSSSGKSGSFWLAVLRLPWEGIRGHNFYTFQGIFPGVSRKSEGIPSHSQDPKGSSQHTEKELLAFLMLRAYKC